MFLIKKKIFYLKNIFILLLLFIPLTLIANDKNIDENLYDFFIEIPAGTKEKWEVNKDNQLLEIEKKNGEKRIINFISYPGNYGFIPNTIADDGDPIDLIDLDESIPRGQITKVKLLGGLYFKDKKKVDVKMIGVQANSTFKNYNSLSELLIKQPAVMEIIKTWFISYKKPGKMVFYKYLTIEESKQFIEEGFARWEKLKDK